MTTREEVVSEARSWLGTPYRDKGRVRGRAVDCLGVVIGVAKGLGLSEFDTTLYGMVPRRKMMGALLREHMREIPITEAGPGDIVWIAWHRAPQHLAILTDVGMLHAYHDGTEDRVVEHPIDSSHRARIRAAFRLPGVD